ncbi:hypothetical protein [Longispora urticae]
MVAGRYSGRLAVSVGIAGAVLFLAAPVAAQPAPSPVVVSPVKPSPSATPSPVPSAALAPQPAAPSQFPNMIGQPAQVPQPAQGQPDQAEPEPDAVEQTPDSRVYRAEPEPLPEPTAAPDGVPVSGTQRDARLPDPKLLIVAGATGLAFSTVGVAVVWYRRRSF